MKPTALVFDLDDTLFAEREFVLGGFAAVDQWLQQQRAVKGFSAEARRLFAEGARGNIFDRALDHLGAERGPDLVAQLVAVYRAHEPQLTLLPEARWALETFRGRFKLGLLTDGYALTQRNKVTALGIAGLFDAIVFTDDLGRANWKPSPAPFLQMMERLGRTGAECVYVADNPAKDFVAPNQLGWLTVQIRREGGEYAGNPDDVFEPDYRANLAIRSLRELGVILA